MDLKLNYDMAKEICEKRFSEHYYKQELACKGCPLNLNSMFYCLKAIIRQSEEEKRKIEIIIKDWK